MKSINWKIFFILLTASILSVLAIFPYLLSLQKEALSALPIPLSLFVLLQIVQSIVLFSILIFIGLILSKRIGFSLPILEKISSGKEYKKDLASSVRTAIPWGILAGILITSSDFIFLQLGMTPIIGENIQPPVWQRFLASFYGGITEEIIMRLFLMSFLIWIGLKFSKKKENQHPILVWIAIIVAAVIFGLGHLPVTATLTELTPIVITREILLNGIGGIIFGWLFWKKGLEAAIIAHFTTDIMILIVLPFVITLF